MGLLILLGLGFLVYWTFLVWVTIDALLRPPRRSLAWCLARNQPETPAALTPPRAFDEGRIPDPRNLPHELPYWRIPGESPTGPIVIFSHGWGQSRQAVLQRLDALLPVCREVIAWDMPGHGEAPRGRGRLGIDESDALGDLLLLAQGEMLDELEHEAAVMEAELEDEADWEEFFDRAPKPGAPSVVLYGFSLGAGVSLDAAASKRKRVAGVIAEAPYRMPAAPARSVMAAKGFPHVLNLRPALTFIGFISNCGPRWAGFDRAELAREIECPVLVLHGERDEMCPPEDGRAVAAAAGRGEFIGLADAGHLDIWENEASREDATKAVRAFISGLSVRATPSQ